MNEKDIFNIIDNISEENLSMIMEKTDTKKYMENSIVDYNEREMIRTKLHEKIRKDIEEQAVSKQNVTSNEEYKIIRLENTELNLKREAKKGNAFKKNRARSRIIKSVIAATLLFLVSVNTFPSLALALVKVPGLNKLIEVVSFDKGFKNVIAKGNIQEVNTSIENNGAKFTVTTIAGDELKLWIGYELEGGNLVLQKIIKFKNKADGKYLPWIGYTPVEGEKYIEVHMDRLVKDFQMEVEIYKDDSSFHTPLSQLDEKTISDVEYAFEKNKITTLNIPISLNDKIYKSILSVFNIQGKEFKSEIGTFKIEKLELAESRSRVYCRLISEENELVDVLVPRLIDGEGKNYSSPNDFTSRTGNNTLCLELSGGVNSIEGLSFMCNGFRYINKQDKFITVDLENQRIEPNNLGISLIGIESSNVILNVPQSDIKFSFEAKNEKGKKVVIKEISVSPKEKTGTSLEEIVKFKFKELKDKKIILNVDSVQYDAPREFNMKLIE
jgi:hypothetical protein